VAPKPGELRLWSYQQIAHGADAIIFFRWRTARYGTEQYWHGLLDHDGTPGRRYEEIAQVGAELGRIGDSIIGTEVKASVAMLLSYDSRFAFQIQPNNPGYSYLDHFQDIYRAFHTRNIPVDVIYPTADLTQYALVLAPPLHVLPQTVATNLEHYVRDGGTLVCFFRSGVKDEANAVVNLPLPGLLAEICGVEVAEYDSMPPGAQNELEWTLPELAGGSMGVASAWADILAPKSAEVVARYTQDYYAGQPAITRNRYGNGSTIYVGSAGDVATHAALAEWLIKQTGISAPIIAPAGVEVTTRAEGSRRFLFVMNHTEASQRLTLDRSYRDLLNDSAPLNGSVQLAAHAVLILEEGG
jgi:beta-galactosidase